jgi:cytochrome oxidase Cu insertion factor (SCO1/SenC/PrrC family)
VENEEKARTGRGPGWITLAIFIICLLPVVAAWWVLKEFQKEGDFATRNYGELITPARPLSDTTLKALDGKELAISELRGKWTLVVLAPSECDERCRTNLYKTRQIRLAVGQDTHRVQRLWLTDEVAPLGKASWLREQHPDLTVVSEGTAKEGFIDQFIVPNISDPLAAQRVYIIDPIGNLVISYPPEEDAEHILKDLKRLLYVSHVG